MMEEKGIVGPFEGSKPRKVLISKQRYMEMKMNGNDSAEQGAVPEAETDEPPFDEE